MGLAQAVDDGEEANDDQARAHEDVADEEDHDDEVADDGERGEGDGIGHGAQALPEGERRHDLGGGLAHERGDGNDGVAVGAQRVDQHRQRGTVAERSPPPSCSRMMEPRNCGLVFMVSNCARTESVISCGRLARMLVPVVGVDLAADDGVAVLLNAHDGRGLVVGVGLLVDVVGRTEVERLNAELAGEEALGELDFQIELAVGDFADVGMGVGVVADLVAFAHDALHQADILRGLGADEHEGALDVLLLEDVEDLRRPLGVGAVVEGERDSLGW